jgi:hypothetical protein
MRKNHFGLWQNGVKHPLTTQFHMFFDGKTYCDCRGSWGARGPQLFHPALFKISFCSPRMGNSICVYDQKDSSMQTPRRRLNKRVTRSGVMPFPHQCQRLPLIEGLYIPIIVINIIKPDLLEIEFKTNSAGEDRLHHRFVSTEILPVGTSKQDIKSLISRSSKVMVSITRDLGCLSIGTIMLSIDNITGSLSVHLIRMREMTQMAHIQTPYPPAIPYSGAEPNSFLDDSLQLPGESTLSYTERTAIREPIKVRDIINPAEYDSARNTTRTISRMTSQPEDSSQVQNIIVHNTQSIHMSAPSTPALENKYLHPPAQPKLQEGTLRSPSTPLPIPIRLDNYDQREERNIDTSNNSLFAISISTLQDQSLQESPRTPLDDMLNNQLEPRTGSVIQLIDPLKIPETMLSAKPVESDFETVEVPTPEEPADQKDGQLIEKSIDKFDLIDNYSGALARPITPGYL